MLTLPKRPENSVLQDTMISQMSSSTEFGISSLFTKGITNPFQ